MSLNFPVHRGLLLALACSLPALSAHAKVVTLAMDAVVDQVAPEDTNMYRVGGHDLDRVTYDDTQVDPKTHRVPALTVSHYLFGHWEPTRPDVAVLDMSRKPYRLSFQASVVHGRPLVVLFEGDSRRFAILARPDFHVLIAGKYVIDPKPLTDAEVAAPPPNANSPDAMPIKSARPPAGAPPRG